MEGVPFKVEFRRKAIVTEIKGRGRRTTHSILS